MLKQLNFYGKQTQAQEIRKDLFQPFAQIVTPSPEFGMNVYQKLREYRHVRDYQWTFRPTTEEVQKTLEKAIKNKRMPKFDNRLPTLKERGMLLMDQKATTIADLADILTRESESARNKEKLEEERLKKAGARKRANWAQVEKLAERARAGELQNYDAWIKRREEQIEAAESERIKARGKKGLMMLKIKRNELLRAKEAFDFVKGLPVDLNQRLKWNKNFSAMVQSRTTRIVNPEKPPPPEETEEEHDAGFEPDIRMERDGYQGPEEILILWNDLSDGYYVDPDGWCPEVMHEQKTKDLTVGSGKYKKTIPDSKYPGNEFVVDGDSAAEAEVKAAKEREAEDAEEKRKNSFMGRFTDTVKAPFTMKSVKPDGEEARR